MKQFPPTKANRRTCLLRDPRANAGMKRTSVVEHNLYFAQARDRGINKGRNLEGLKQIINNYDIQNTIINNYDIQNTIPNNEIIPDLNKLKIPASTNYWRILNFFFFFFFFFYWRK